MAPRRPIRFSLALLIALGLCGSAVSAGAKPTAAPPGAAAPRAAAPVGARQATLAEPGRIVVHLRGAPPPELWARARHDAAARLNAQHGFVTLDHADPSLLARLMRAGIVIGSEPDRTYATQGNYKPNDLYFPDQWDLRDPSAMGFPTMWDQVPLTPVTVAVIDTGIDLDHPDLARHIWTNRAEIPGNGIDDDGDGLVDDVHGYDFARNRPDPIDHWDHGTWVAGVIGAVRNNRIGTAGIAPAARLMSLDVVGDDFNADGSNIAAAIDYALAHGVRIINLSLGGGGDSDIMHEAIQRAGRAGALVVTASGNDHVNLDAQPTYPACYHEHNLITVAATRRSGSLAGLSNYGATCTALAAPGIDISTTQDRGEYASADGTSLAAPHVSGIAALLLAAYPAASAAQLTDALLSSARWIGPRIEYGSVDALGALQALG